jgi:large subunit ribosomal protein L29
MKADKVREFDTADLKQRIQESEEQLFRLRFQIGMGQAEGVNKYRETRRDRARMLGVLRERELDPAKEAASVQSASTKKKGKK